MVHQLLTPRRGRQTYWTEERIAGAMAGVAAKYGVLTIIGWRLCHLTPSVDTILRVFGGWAEAWRAAGYSCPSRGIDRTSALEELRRAAIEHGGRAWTEVEWCAKGRSPSVPTVRRLFGGWSAAWRAAGCVPNRPGQRRYRPQSHPDPFDRFADKVRKGARVADAARALGVPRSTAYVWAAQVREEMLPTC